MRIIGAVSTTVAAFVRRVRGVPPLKQLQGRGYTVRTTCRGAVRAVVSRAVRAAVWRMCARRVRRVKRVALLAVRLARDGVKEAAGRISVTGDRGCASQGRQRPLEGVWKALGGAESARRLG